MRVIYVDDEQPALDNFRLTIANFTEIDDFEIFQNGENALEYVKDHIVDVAFLDIEMPRIHGIELAHKMKEINENIRIIFVTAYSKYAMDAWHVDALGYILKPYTVEDIKKALYKCTYRPLESKKISIQTIPNLLLTVNGESVYIKGEKPRELFALLVDRGEKGITTGEGIACLWPDRSNDANTQSLYRMTYKRLAETLDDAGVGHIICSQEKRRFLRTDQVDCDLYRILNGDTKTAKKYAGYYMKEYEWAEERNGQLYRMLLG